MTDTRAYNTRQYEVNAVGDSATDLLSGMAVKFTKLPAPSTPATIYDKSFYIAAWDVAGDEVCGVVSLENPKEKINNLIPGRVVMMNAGIIPVLSSGVLKKGDPIKPMKGGKWEKAVSKDLAYGIMLEDAVKDQLALAKPDRFIV